MKTKVTFIVIICIISLFLFFGIQIGQKFESRNTFLKKINNIPSLSSFRWLNKQASVGNEKTIIIFFHPTCEHCQYEASAISEKKTNFINTHIWWISTAEISMIQEFRKKYGLLNLNNNYFGYLPPEKINQTFGSISVPHIFIYGKDQLLLKEFKGETKIEALLKYAQAN